MTKFSTLKTLISITFLACIINFIFFTKGAFTWQIIYTNSGWIISSLAIILYIVLTYKEFNVRASLLSLVPFILIELFARVFSLYKVFPLIDIPSHFFAGVGIGTILFLLYKRDLKSTMFFTFLISLAAELSELFNEIIVPQPIWLRDCLLCRDGITDIVMTLIGAVIIWVALDNLKLKR